MNFIQNIKGIFLEASHHSFIEIISLLGIVIFLFEILNIFQNENLIKKIEKSKNVQPVIGALLGLVPGCAGSIVIMPLFLKGSIGFGAIVATLIATLGDSAFVLISHSPTSFALVSLVTVITGIIIGYLVDQTSLGNRLYNEYKEREDNNKEEKESHIEKRIVFPSHLRIIYLLYFISLVLGFGFFIFHILGGDIHNLRSPHIVSGLGIFFTILVHIINKKRKIGYFFNTAVEESMFSILNEVAFIGLWVFMAFFLYDLTVLLMGRGIYANGETLIANFIQKKGFMAILVAGLIGMIPGCGPQIIFVSLFIKGLVPFSALLANSISQDGDALFPLLAKDKKSAIYATIINLIPALIIGFTFYFLGY